MLPKGHHLESRIFVEGQSGIKEKERMGQRGRGGLGQEWVREEGKRRGNLCVYVYGRRRGEVVGDYINIRGSQIYLRCNALKFHFFVNKNIDVVELNSEFQSTESLFF